MGKAKIPSTAFLDRDLSWSHQEILAEALLVIWLATKVSVEFSRQFFPEWRESRIDPETGGEMGRNLSRLLLGADSTSCFWNRAASFWKQYHDSACHNSSLPLPDPDAAKIAIGYYGVMVMHLTTAVLYVSFFCSLFVNRHWKLPIWRVPYLATFEENGGKSRKGQTDHTDSNAIWNHPVIIVFLAMVTGAALIAGMLVTAVAWLIFSVGPVVLSTSFLVRAVGAVYGEEVAFPCYVILTCVLTVYCTGRICGVWMNDCYVTSFPSPLRKLRSVTVTGTAEPSTILTDCYGIDFRWIVKFGLGCLIIWTSVWPFVCRQFPHVIHYLPLEPLMKTDEWFRTSNSTEKLDRTDALLSYWVDASDLFGSARNVKLPEVSPLSQSIGRVYLGWNIGLTVATVWFLYFAFFLDIAVGIVICGTLVVCLCCRCLIGRKGTSASTKDNTERPIQDRLVGGTSSPSKPENVSVPDKNLTVRRNESILDLPRISGAVAVNLLTFQVIPYLAAEFFLPERYQLPGILFLATCFTVWIYCLAVPRFMTLWRNHISDRTTHGEHQRLLDSKNPTYATNNKKDYGSVDQFA